MKPFCATWACTAALMCLVTVTIAAEGPPRMPLRRVLNRRELYYKHGGITTFPCEATGDPQPTYRWTRNGQYMEDYASSDRFEIDSKTGSMRLRTGDGDEGQYRCLAVNSYGVAAGEIIWFVRAQLSEFKSETRQSTVLYITDSITMPSFRPTNVPDHGVHWVTIGESGQRVQVQTDDRVVVDLNGDLHFTNVVENDSNKYYCVATNVLLGEEKMSVYNQFDAREGGVRLRSPKPMFISPLEMVGIKGENVKFQCIFSGNPTPKVEWLKVFGPLPVGRHKTTEGGVLEITDLQEADAAVDGYRCVVRDSTGNVQAGAYFSLVIEAAPYKIDGTDGTRPEERAVGETASFNCQAAGNPSPFYQWYINGVPLYDVTDRRIAGSSRVHVHRSDPSRLAISNLTTEDTMAIQCNASNKHGYLWDNTFIKITDKGSPPFIYTQSTHQTVWFKPNSKAELPCKASGIPQPEYKWMKNGNDLAIDTSDTNKRLYQVAHEGSLVITKVEAADEGYYQCVAINDNGVSASDKVRLRIAKMDSLPVPTAIEKHHVNLGDVLTLSCRLPYGGPTFEVSWLYKRETMQQWQRMPLEETVIPDLQGRLHLIDVSESNNLDLYRCKVENEILEDEVLGQVHEILVQTGQDVELTAPFAVYLSPHYQLALVGDTIRLQCIFGGHPTPNVIWTRDGGKPLLDEKDRIGVSGTLLEIPVVRYSDAGNYSCFGNNSADGTRAHRTINVRVESYPTWEIEPRSQTLAAGGKASFRCKGHAEPEPNLAWFVNGVPLEEAKRHYGSRLWNHDQTIGLNDLTLHDDMVFQCNVSNKHGYLWADFYLNIDGTGDTSAAPQLQASFVSTILPAVCWLSQLVLVGRQS